MHPNKAQRFAAVSGTECPTKIFTAKFKIFLVPPGIGRIIDDLYLSSILAWGPGYKYVFQPPSGVQGNLFIVTNEAGRVV